MDFADGDALARDAVATVFDTSTLQLRRELGATSETDLDIGMGTGGVGMLVLLNSPACGFCARFKRDVAPMLTERLGKHLNLVDKADDPSRYNVVRARHRAQYVPHVVVKRIGGSYVYDGALSVRMMEELLDRFLLV